MFISLLCFFMGFALMLISGNPLINWLRHKRWKKGTTQDETWTVREDTPDTHLAKQGTPSMGGIGIVACTLVALLALGTVIFGGRFTLFQVSPSLSSLRWDALLSMVLVPCVLLFHGLLGFADDWSKASGRGGLRARAKLLGQVGLAVVFVLCLYLLHSTPEITGYSSTFESAPLLALGLGVCAFALVATSNAANLTDGIDGLAAGLTVQCGFFLFYAGAGQGGVSQNASMCSMALAGACLGFLIFNRYPAKVFMGDTGSLAIGATLGAVAILQHALFLLPFVGFMFFVEMFSVMAQVVWFKYTKRKTGEGKRLFRRAPLHHHFELGGWTEWRVVATFWLVNLLASVLGLVLWQMGILPRWP